MEVLFSSSTPGPSSEVEESIGKSKENKKIKSLALSSHTCEETREPGRAFSCQVLESFIVMSLQEHIYFVF